MTQFCPQFISSSQVLILHIMNQWHTISFLFLIFSIFHLNLKSHTIIVKITQKKGERARQTSLSPLIVGEGVSPLPRRESLPLAFAALSITVAPLPGLLLLLSTPALVVHSVYGCASMLIQNRRNLPLLSTSCYYAKVRYSVAREGATVLIIALATSLPLHQP